jgi:hypothetical protein
MKLYQQASRGYLPTGYSSFTPSREYGYQKVLVDGRYVLDPGFTNRGCAYGPTSYIEDTGNQYLTPSASNPVTVSIGMNTILQRGIGIMPSSPSGFGNYGPFGENEIRLRRAGTQVMLTACCVTGDAAVVSLNHTLGVTDAYLGNQKIPARHFGELLPMSFYDGHGSLVKAEDIVQNPFTYPPAIVSQPYRMIDWSLMPKYRAPNMDN